MEDFLYPLEFHESGRVKTRLRAEKVSPVSSGNHIQAEQVVLDFFDEQGEPQGRLWAEDCRIDRDRGEVVSESALRMERPGVTLTGRGFRWHMETQTLEIFHDVRVEMAEGYGEAAAELVPPD